MNNEVTDELARDAHPAVTGRVSTVAAITASFWILKIVITSVGDLSGDALSISLGLGYLLALAVAVAFLAVVLFVQLRTRRFVPWVYWLALFGSAVAGAEISDSIDRALHWGSVGGTVLLALGTVLILGIWRVHRGALRSDLVEDRRDERYYWLAAIAANSLGSALGDLLGDKLGLGLLGATGVYLGTLALLLVLHSTTRASKGVLFWLAFVITRVPF